MGLQLLGTGHQLLVDADEPGGAYSDNSFLNPPGVKADSPENPEKTQQALLKNLEPW